MRVYLDTNVIVSAVATRGLCADVLQVVLAEHHLVVGEAMLSELSRVLQQKLGLPTATVNELLAFLRRQATVVPRQPAADIKGLDPEDAAVTTEAAAGGVDLLVTGDQKLLSASGLSIKTASPREFWDQVRRAT